MSDARSTTDELAADLDEAPEPTVTDPATDEDPQAGESVGADPATDEAAEASADQADATVPDVVDSDELLDEEAAPRPVSPYDRPGRWYVVHTQSGYEKKVKQNLEARTTSMNMEDRIHEVVIPMEDTVEVKGGKKVVVQKKMFPGYLLVRCQ